MPNDVLVVVVVVGRTWLDEPPQNTTVNPFELFTRERILRCVASSDPSTRPIVTWYRLTNGSVTQVNTAGSDRLSVRSDGSLVFRGVAETKWRALIGWYRCVADNGYTSDSADVFLDALTSPPVRTRRESFQLLSEQCFITSLPVGVQSIMISVSVCLSVCLLAYLKNHTSRFHQIFCTRYLWPWHGLLLTAVQ